MERNARIFVAGHKGLVGSAILRRLATGGYTHLLTAGRDRVDLENERAVDAFFAQERPEYVFLAAAKVGGILANSRAPVDFLERNLRIELNVVSAAFRHQTKKLLFLGSSCIYPKFAPQPISEAALLTGALEPTNEWYAVAKIAGIKLCQAYRKQHGFDAISAMPTNLYGPGDNFDLETSHVLPALIRKFHEAKVAGLPEVEIWGSGRVRREFLHVDDCADAVVFLMEKYSDEEIVNVGTGIDMTIKELAELVGRVVGFEGRMVFDATKPDGTPRKQLDTRKLMRLGWEAKIRLEEGLAATYSWFIRQLERASTGEGGLSPLP